MSRRVVGFAIFFRHQLQNTPLDQQKARAGVKTRDKSIHGLALFAFARHSYVAKLGGLQRFSVCGALESRFIIVEQFQRIHACDDILIEVQHSLNLVHAEAYVRVNEHQMGFSWLVKKSCHDCISTPSYQRFIGDSSYRYM